ncbi:hypothetical protein BpHYR1_030692 [Brachionus plicatilis]|uniref:Reverse transcriptase domain-containing protein n=1 Tax=Brachionus plicatilis TaxID=10195 RepID=A0A3M7SB81_BRAPC|nr:hypothetical protein BpHYR1_030692 [Brachionus plicatilis]
MNNNFNLCFVSKNNLAQLDNVRNDMLIMNFVKTSPQLILSDQLNSAPFKIESGVKQGGLLSSFLFNIFIEDLNEDHLKQEIGAQFKNNNASKIRAEKRVYATRSPGVLRRQNKLSFYDLISIYNNNVSLKEDLITEEKRRFNHHDHHKKILQSRIYV